jgi:hypothetical protein
MPRLLAPLLLLTCCAPLAAQQPPSIDATIDRIADIRAKRAELEKQEAAAVGDLKTLLKALNERIDKLGLVDPPKPPPVPVPPTPPPAPVDPLKAKLKAAFDADPVQLDTRRSQALDLAALWKLMVGKVEDKKITTASELRRQYKEAAADLLKDPEPTEKVPKPRVNLEDVRRCVAFELGVLLPNEGDLTAEQRASVSALFAKLALCIEEIAK